MSEEFASETRLESDWRTRDGLGSWRQAVAALREMGIRSGAIAPINDDERRQAAEGPRDTRELDCVRREP